MKQQDILAIEEIISDGFQSVHSDGARDRRDEIKLINELDMGDFRLDDFRVTREGPVLVVTYRAEAEEIIEGQRLSARPAMRMSLFFDTDSGWKWLSHSNSKVFIYKQADELIDFVTMAAALIAQEGENSFENFRIQGSKWFQDDHYLFIWDLGGLRHVYPPDPGGEGKNMMQLQDIDNKPIGKWFIEVASSTAGKGWVHYRWPKPGKIQPSWKSTYVMRVAAPSGKEYLVGSGAYNMQVQREFVIDAVDAATRLIESEGHKALETIRDKSSRFRFQETYIFIIEESGIELLNPAFPNLEGRNLYDIRDVNGKYLVREFIDLAKRKGKGWVDYMWPKPGEAEPSQKTTFIRKAMMDGKMVIVGAGLYEN